MAVGDGTGETLELTARLVPGDHELPVRAARSERGSLPQWIYAQIRLDIMSGEYPAGMRLNEQRLAEQLDVSRVPLRESFLRLERDGFIRQLPRRSAVVTGWDAGRINNLFDARLVLEVESTRLATERISRGAPTAELEQMVERALHAIHRDDPLGVAENSTEFHRLVVKATGNDLLISLMDQLAQRVTWLFYLTSSRDLVQACTEHRDLVDVMTSGNAELARSVAYAHIEKGRIPTLEALQALEDEAEPLLPSTTS